MPEKATGCGGWTKTGSQFNFASKFEGLETKVLSKVVSI
jgi:hypothetical protein